MGHDALNFEYLFVCQSTINSLRAELISNTSLCPKLSLSPKTGQIIHTPSVKLD